ncbi:MAG: Na/Pi symporter, partial [Bacteroidales bacterium]|nr:Na/Pi symporter [Bacteroidales bacterium]
MPLVSIILTIFTLIGAIGLFLFGMKLMSEALQKVAGQRMRGIISAVTTNPFRGLTSGIIITAAIQSSSASTVMITGLVNAGLLSLRQSLPLIFGANIGTTLKSWLISTIGFRIDLNQILLPVVAIILFFLFSQNFKKKSVGELLMGFALLFLGL